MKIKLWIAGVLLLFAMQSNAWAEEKYIFDIKGQHAFIQFKVKHLGYSWLLGEFRTFDGSFTYNEKHPENNQVHVNIDMESVDTNHAERNKHLRSADFFDVKQFPKATFVSTSYKAKDATHAVVYGDLTLRGVTKNIAIEITQIGTGKDPWGGYRRGFEGHAILHLSDYNMPFAPKLGPASDSVELFLSIEGLRQ